MNRIWDWSENLYIIFGTSNLLKAILFPSERVLPLRGIEWSFLSLEGSSAIEMSSKDNML